MNYLAHLYLSGNDEATLVGNFIGDFVKGRNYERFPPGIRNGVLLHRQIDAFTDSHPNFKAAKKYLSPEYGLYSGIIVDFFYDHFLALYWENYSEQSLRSFSKWAHAVLLSNFSVLPFRVQGFLPFLIQNRRLESYASVDGIIRAIDVMSRYTSLPAKSDFAHRILMENYDAFSTNFEYFMRKIMQFVDSKPSSK